MAQNGSKIIGGIVLGAIAVSAFKYMRKDKNSVSLGSVKSGDSNGVSLFDQKSKSGHKIGSNEESLTSEAQRMFDELRTEAKESFERLKRDTESKRKQFNDKLMSRVQQMKTSADGSVKEIQTEIQQNIKEFKEEADHSIKVFQKEIEDKKNSIRQKAIGVRDEAMDGLKHMSNDSRELAIKWKKDVEDYLDKTVNHAKTILDKYFPQK